MRQYTKLYKRAKTGKIQVWWQERDGNKIRNVSGQLDGKMTYSLWKECFGKNIGKSNETSDSEQAHSMIMNNYKKQKAQGNYHEDINSVDNETYFKPMLAQKYTSWEDLNLQGDDNVFISPKLDGIRCVISKDGMFSRNGKPIISCPHIFDSLQNFFERYPNVILDGELYNHDLHDNFNRIASIVSNKKKSNGKESWRNDKVWMLDYETHGDEFENTAEEEINPKNIQYHIYDISREFGSYIERMRFINNEFCLSYLYIKIVEQIECFSRDCIEEFHSEFLAKNYEGSMVRISSDRYPYENFRSKSLLKLKTQSDEEYVIEEVLEGHGNRANMAGSFVYRTASGKKFNTGIKGGEDLYREIWKNKESYIGTVATVQYMNLTPDGIPRFGVTIKLHGKKREF